ncbi:hypothetical protein niasHT_033297 [Heterodera trifolii]|uniref:Uncharacterized protein n=1 Tax=Heterodera trifolii TaxID=157864 RepID=A0ABD2I0M7_9BILA
MASLSFRNLMGHVLVAERVFATMNFRKYTENRSTKQFAICWIGILLSENVRTAKQLAPTIFLHFLNANALNLVTFLIYFGYLDKDYQQSLAYQFMALQNSVCCSCIEITVITHHPMIKRKAVVWLKNFFSFVKPPSSSVADSSVPIAVQNGQNLGDIRGQKLLTESEMQIYFKNLEEAWK